MPDDDRDIQPARVRALNDRPIDEGGAYVLYWMQASQRTTCNHALEHAVRRADELGKPLVVCFGLMDGYPEANARHYTFMVEGLRDVAAALAGRGIKFVCRHGDPPVVALHYARDAALLVGDLAYTRYPRDWYEAVAAKARVRYVQVESEVVVPVNVASAKREFAARTLRPKIHKVWARLSRAVGGAVADEFELGPGRPRRHRRRRPRGGRGAARHRPLGDEEPAVRRRPGRGGPAQSAVPRSSSTATTTAATSRATSATAT